MVYFYSGQWCTFTPALTLGFVPLSKTGAELLFEVFSQRYEGGSTLVTSNLVRRHINWNNQRPDPKEDLAHLVQDIKRRICGIASAGFPSSSA